jgi:alpha-ribazole phosphatase
VSKVRIYLIRHGETEYNREGRYQGTIDVPLSQRGQEQAASLAHRLREEEIEAIYTSDLGRARETAQAIARDHDLDVIIEEGLRERGFGQWEGLTFGEIKERFPQVASHWLQDPLHTEVPGGEDFGAFQRRIIATLDGIRRRHREGNIAVITHGGPILAILAHILQLEGDGMLRLRLDNACLSIIEYFGPTPVLILWNDTCHLPEKNYPYFQYK